jgi:hypothetical protein
MEVNEIAIKAADIEAQIALCKINAFHNKVNVYDLESQLAKHQLSMAEIKLDLSYRELERIKLL